MTNPILKRAIGHGVAINIATWEGKAGPIICIHGITANCRCWDGLARSLSPAYRVLAMDLRGRGRSEKPASGYALTFHVQDIRSLLDDLRIDRAVIMGHSLGAFIGLAFAAEHPERTAKLILVDGGGDLSPEQMGKVFAGIKPSLDRLGRVYPDAEAYLLKMRQAPFIQPWSPAIENYYRYEIEDTDGGVRTNIAPAHIAEEAENLRKAACAPYYARVRCEVLILRATDGLLSDDDLLLPAEAVNRMRREIRKARIVNVAGVNHYGIIFQPHPARDRAIREFLEEA
jgi:pimeloyl-ACP methyl ester carboxylesterase